MQTGTRQLAHANWHMPTGTCQPATGIVSSSYGHLPHASRLCHLLSGTVAGIFCHLAAGNLSSTLCYLATGNRFNELYYLANGIVASNCSRGCRGDDAGSGGSEQVVVLATVVTVALNATMVTVVAVVKAGMRKRKRSAGLGVR